MTLTDIQIKSFKASEKRYLKPDGEGLNLAVTPLGKKTWVVRYRIKGKADSLTIGSYGSKPNQLSIQQARYAKNNVKLLLAKGLDPKDYKHLLVELDVLRAIHEEQLITTSEASKNERANELLFNQLYDEYCKFKTTVFGGNKPAWEYGTLKKHNERFYKYVMPLLANKYVVELTEDDLEQCLIKVQNNGALVSRNKIRTVFNGMFDYAKGKKYIQRNIAKYISDSLFVKHKEKHYKHVTTESELKKIVMAVESIQASYEVKQCLKLGLLIFVRPSELSQMRWEQVSFSQKLISIHSSEMKKNNKDFLIPISKQSNEILEEIYQLTGHSKYVFYSPYGTGKPISANSLSNALKRNGITEIQPHGFRHTASTMLNEMGFDKDAIELQLSHVIGGVRGIYNKAQKLDKRAKMMQVWAEYIQGLKK